MRMSKTNQKILNTLLAIDIGIIIFCMLAGHRSWLYTTQIGFFTSALVIAASMVSYRRMIEKRLKQGTALPDDDRDDLDKIDDPHDLYDNEKEAESEALSKEAFAKMVDEEKGKEKEQKRSISEVIKDSRASLSFYRIAAYLLLVLGFFYLNRHNYLHIPSYLFSLSVPPVIVIIMLMRESRASEPTEGSDNEKKQV